MEKIFGDNYSTGLGISDAAQNMLETDPSYNLYDYDFEQSISDPGMHDSLPNELIFDHRACKIGFDENNLQEWNWDNGNYTLPFNVTQIKSIELISSGRNLVLRKENGYTGCEANKNPEIDKNDCLLSLDNNVIIIYDAPGRAAEYKFKVTFI